jgi:integrase
MSGLLIACDTATVAALTSQNGTTGGEWGSELPEMFEGGRSAVEVAALLEVDRSSGGWSVWCGGWQVDLRTLDLVLAKAFVEQVGRTLGARKPCESDDVRPVWSLAEARRFGDHVGDDRLYPLWRLLLVTGLRRGELCGLRCGDLEPVQGTLTVHRQLVVEDPGSRVRVKPPKSHNGVRTLVLDPVTLELLGPFAAGPASRYLFAGRWGKPIRPDNLTDRFNQLAVAAKVRPIGPHQIRHLIASTLLDAGYGVHEVAERLGHDPATLMRYYTRVSAARRLQATDRIAELMTASEIQPRSLRNWAGCTTNLLPDVGSPWRCAPAEARKACIRIQATAGRATRDRDPETRLPAVAVVKPATARLRVEGTE